MCVIVIVLVFLCVWANGAGGALLMGLYLPCVARCVLWSCVLAKKMCTVVLGCCFTGGAKQSYGSNAHDAKPDELKRFTRARGATHTAAADASKNCGSGSDQRVGLVQ